MHNRLAARATRLLFSAAFLLVAASGQADAQRLSGDRMKNGSRVRSVFKTVVADSVKATVEVLVRGKRVAFGTIVDQDGYILTKASRLKAGDVSVRLFDDRKLPAKRLGGDSTWDLVMLKVDATDLPVVQWADEEDPDLGQWLASTGSDDLPFAVGVVSVERLNIPRQRGVLGVAIEDAKAGPRITQIFPNSGADKAGLKVGDIVKRIAGKLVVDRDGLSTSVRQFRPGEALSISVTRGGKAVDVKVTLGHAFQNMLNRGALQNRMGGELSIRRGGFPAALQHDSILKPDECGGPLVNLSGKVVGLNIARGGRTESYAVPASEILPLLEGMKAEKLASGSASKEPSKKSKKPGDDDSKSDDEPAAPELPESKR